MYKIQNFMLANNNVNLAIDDFYELINSKEIKELSKLHPSGTTWLDFSINFKKYVENIENDYRDQDINKFFNILMSEGAINTPPSFPDSSVGKLKFKWYLDSSCKYLSLIDKYPQIKESDLIKGNCVNPVKDGRNFSLDTFRYLGYLDKINSKLCDVKKIERYLEIGSGNGGFARTLKLINPKLKITLIDLPIVLFIARIFLEYSFPESKHFFLTSLSDLNNSKIFDADFVYINNLFFQEWSKTRIKIDLFCNMRSMGEMSLNIPDFYIGILKDMNIKNIFLENRYLNRYSNYHRFVYNFRKDEIAGSTWMKNNWETIDFDLEPDWTKSPYESDHPRYLALCMKSKKNKSGKIILKKDHQFLISSIKKQKWYFDFNNLHPSNLASKPLFVDHETLMNLWEINRKNPTKESLKLIIDFISYCFGSSNVEEIDYYQIQLEKKFKIRYKPITQFSFRKFVWKILYKIKKKFLD